MNLDRFSVGLPDQQEEDPVLSCSVCGFEFYQGEEYVDIDGKPCCMDAECLVKFLSLRVKRAE